MGGRLVFDAPLAPLTTYGTGGPADVLARPDSAEELAELLKIQTDQEMPVHILGGGANTLFADEGFRGLVIKLGRMFQTVQGSVDGQMSAGAGVPTAGVLENAAVMEFSGLEGLAGIPGSIGGALMMNAGSFGLELGSVVEAVYGLDGRGRHFRREKVELKFEYRRLTGLPEGAVILGTDLRLSPGRPEDIRKLMAEYQRRRAESQPKGLRSAGSVFKNPPGLYAGKLIEECGFKGTAVGGAEVSEVHANFIVVRDRAESGQIIELMNKIRAGVREKCGVALEPEIKIIGPRGPLAPAPLEADNGR